LVFAFAFIALKFLNSDKLGNQYENDMFVADVIWGNIYHFKLNDNGSTIIYSLLGQVVKLTKRDAVCHFV
jgi:hypothetical protein